MIDLPQERQEELMREAMRLAEETASQGNLPFAALLIDKEGDVILTAKNTVRTSNNNAAHAEINLLFEAAKSIDMNNLSDYIILSNAASCPMCVTALIKAKIRNFYYGAPNEGTSIPNITMEEIIERVPFPLNVHGSILGSECAEQIKRLAQPNRERLTK